MDPDTSPSSSSSSPVVSYLINSCGLSEDRAVSIGKKLPLTTTTSYLETIITTLESYGFTKSHISKIIIKTPRFLEYGRCGHLKLKLGYFKSKEISTLEMVKFLICSPEILIRGLKDKIIPLFDSISSIVGSDRDTFKVIGNTYNDMRCLSVEFIQERISGNLQVLRDEGIPERVIVNFLIQVPKVCLISTDKFKERVQDVKDMGINPHKTPSRFVSWIRMLVVCSKTTLEAKMNVLRKWGWPEDILLDQVLKNPGFMTISVAKIEAVLDYLVTQMGYNISSFVKVLGVFNYSLEKRIIPRISVHRFLISMGLIKCNGTLSGVLNITDENFLRKFVMSYKVEAPELLQIYNQASITCVTEGSQSEEGTNCPERAIESVAALPKVAKLVDKNDAGKPKKKASSRDLVEPEEELDKEKESMKSRKPRKILKKPEKKVDKVQGGAAEEKGGHHNIDFDEEEKDKSKEEEETVVVRVVGKVLDGSLAIGLKRKVALDKEVYPKKAKKPKKVLKKSKKRVEEVQGDTAKKEEEDKSKEEGETVVVPMLEELKNAKRHKKKFVNKDDVETPELLQVYNQASITCVMEDSQSEEVTKCPERAIESVAALPKVAKLVDESGAGKPKKKASSRDLVEPEEELDKEEESKAAKKPRKFLKRSKKRVEDLQDGCEKKEKRGHSNIEFDAEEKDKVEEEKEIVAVPIAGEVLEGSLASGLKRKVALDKEEDPKKVKNPRKVLKKSKKKVEEMQGDAAKKEEEDKSKEEEEIVVVPMVEVLKKAKRPKKKFVNKDDVETPELLQASNMRANEDLQSEEVVFCPEKATESAAALPKVAKVVDKNQVGKLKKKASSSDLVEQEEELEKEEESKTAKKPRKILKRSKKRVEELQDGCAMKEKRGHSNIEFDAEEKDMVEEEKEIVAVPIVGEVLEGSLASGIKRKVALDKEEDPKKVKNPRKVLKKSKKKVEEMQGDAAKKEEEDKSKEEEEIVVVPMVEVLKKAKRPKKKFVNKDDVETPELLQASNMRANEDLQSEEVIFCPEKATESAAALPKVAKVVDKNQVGKLKKKASSSDLVEQEEELEKEEESKTAKKPRKILKRSKKRVEELQDGCAMKEKRGHSNIEFDAEEKDMVEEEKEIVAVPIVGEVLEGSLASGIKRKVALDKEEDPKKVKNPRKVLKKSKKKVEEMQGDAAKKEEEDKSKEEEEIVVVPMVEVLKKAKRPKKKFVNKDDVETPELLQASNMRANEDLQSEEVIFCPEKATESAAALPKVAKVVDKNQVGKLKKKASSSDLVEQEEELEKEEESKTAKKPRKILKRSKKRVEELQDGCAMKEKRGHSNVEFDAEKKDKVEEEKEIVAVPMGGRELEGSQVSALKRKISLDKRGDLKKVKKLKKVLKRSKKKVEEVQGDDVEKPEEHNSKENIEFDAEEKDKFEEEKEIVAVPMGGRVLEGSQVSALEKKIALDKGEDLTKVKKLKKVLKKSKKKVEEVQGDDVKKPEEHKSNEEEEMAAVPMVENIS
ncbi:claspin-like [Papaver somniferum]|uniref:claspin-like n=1 Tax=Papaver somniferum TaxID=3469 RepID=UPI000E6F7C21|nr:claspin-like [Papaver somniferum]XP_026447265.1 claspin-like [Papaver somniferum]XP_026447266.1 claspin-like [Papaver somniferum]